MTKFYTWIVNHQKAIIAVFVVLAAVCLACKQLVAVNYDMNDYLPQESPSTQALDVMEQEYSGGIPNARVMVENVSVPQALEYKEKLLAVDGVTAVTWLDDAVSVTVPLETLDPDTVETYYKDGSALFSVTIDEDKMISAVQAIRAIIGEENAMAGSAVTTAVATTSTVNEITKEAAMAVDYSVFLLHRFAECRKSTPDPKEAMVQALTMSTTSILSSGLTTVIGFLDSGAAELNSSAGKLSDATGTLNSKVGQLNTGAVSQAASGAETLHSGMETLHSNTGVLETSVGTLDDAVNKLYGGTQKLADGTSEFVSKTSGMDAQIQDQIDSMLDSVRGGDGPTVSFVSDKNTNVTSVQFVLKTAAVEKPAAPAAETEEETPLTFWQKLLRLFGRY